MIYVIAHDTTGRVRCCQHNGNGGAHYPSIHAAERAIHTSDPNPTIHHCTHPHTERDGGLNPCSHTDRPCPIQRR